MRRVSTVAMVIVLLLGACSGDDEGAATTSEAAAATTPTPSTLPSSTTSSTTTTATTTLATTTTLPTTTTVAPTTAPPTTAPPTSAPPPPTTAEPPPPCIGTPSTPLPTGATNQSSAVGDLDGDGAADKVRVYELDGAWGVNVRLAYGWETGLGLDSLMGDGAAASASAVVDIGGPAALIDLGLTLIGPRFGFFVLDGCELVVVARPNGELPDFVFGGGLMHQEWFTCTGEGVVQFSVAMAQDDGEEAVPATLTERPYDYQSAEVVFRPGDTTEEDVEGATMEDLLALYPHCGTG